MTAVIWIDWYAYHLSRFRALTEHSELKGKVAGIELVGGCGVHTGLKFRDNDRSGLPICSLLPQEDWAEAGQWRLARILWTKLNQLKPSTVLVPGYYTLPAIAAAVWARVHGKRSVLMSETTRFDHKRTAIREYGKRLLTRSLFEYAIAGGKPHIQYLEELGFPTNRIGTYYDVVDNDFYSRATDEARAAGRPLDLPNQYFLYVGRLSIEKNLLGLLREFAQYRRRGGRWSLVLVGDGAQRAQLESEAISLGIFEDIRFAGMKSTAETIPYYAFTSCFILPSTREPWGLVVNEAMASRNPVIVSAQCGCVEDLIQEGVNGFTFDPARSGELAQTLKSIEDRPESDRKEMGERAQARVFQYSPQHWADEVARITRVGLTRGVVE